MHSQQPGGQKLWLHKVCADSRVLLRSPAVRTKSPALQARLSELQKQVDQRRYDAMVRDVTHAVRTCSARSLPQNWLSGPPLRARWCSAAPTSHGRLTQGVPGMAAQEREALAAAEGGMVSYKAQLSVGLHILVMMGTFYSAGHVGASYVSADKTHVPSWPLAAHDLQPLIAHAWHLCLLYASD